MAVLGAVAFLTLGNIRTPAKPNAGINEPDERNSERGPTNETDGVKTKPRGSQPGAKPVVITRPTLLTTRVAAGELSGEEVYAQLLKSAIFIATSDGFGSGVLLDTDNNLAITNEHVTKDATQIRVFFPAYSSNGELITEAEHYLKSKSNRGIPARVVHKRASKDLALIELDRVPENVGPIPFAKDTMKPGSKVYSIGGSGVSDEFLWRFTTGTVRGRRQLDNRERSYQCLETDAPTNKGDSGGPVVNSRGQLVAVVSAFATMGRSISINVDLTEVRDFTESYFRSIGNTWAPHESGTDSIKDIPNDVFSNLLAVLQDGEATDRIEATRRLGALGEQARAAVPQLLASAKDASPELMAAILVALRKIGPPEPGAEKVLVSALASSSGEVKAYAARTLAMPSTSMPTGARETLLSTLQDNSSPEVQSHAALALVRTAMDATEDDIRSIWVPLITHPSAELRRAAISAITSSPDHLSRFGKALVPLISDPEPTVRQAIAIVAGQMDNVIGLSERLEKQLRNESQSSVRAALAESLCTLLPNDSVHLPLLRQLLKDDAPDVRFAAATKVGQLGEEAKEAVAELVPLISDRITAVRVATLKALAGIGVTDTKGVVAIVATLFEDPDMSSEVLAAAVPLLAVAGSDGIESLAILARKPLPASVRTQMCLTLAETPSVREDLLDWMIEQVEDLKAVRQAVGSKLAKAGGELKDYRTKLEGYVF